MSFFQDPDPFDEPSPVKLAKEKMLDAVIKARNLGRRYLNRSDGEAAEAARGKDRHVLIRQGDGRYLSIPAMTSEQIKQTLSTSLDTRTKTQLGFEEFRNRVADLLDEDFRLYYFLRYLKTGEAMANMAIEDKVSQRPVNEVRVSFQDIGVHYFGVSPDNGIKIDICAHGMLIMHYSRPPVPRNAGVDEALHEGSSSPVSDAHEDLAPASGFDTPHDTNAGSDSATEV